MKDAFYLAWRFLGFYRWRTALLSLSLGVLIALPFALRLLLAEAESLLNSRARDTPLVLGARASALDLVMNTLYFTDGTPPLIDLADAEAVRDSGLAAAVPMYARFRARRHPVVGTTVDYFTHRSLRARRGRLFAVIGEAVLGATAADDLRLAVGQTLVTTPENAFDIAGVYPLELDVVGILAPSDSADDDAVFVDVKTAWIIQGLGHGHDDLRDSAGDVLLPGAKDVLTANAKLALYRRIDAANIASFHFHGDAARFPLSAVLVVPRDARSAALLRGRHLEGGHDTQLTVPREVVDALVANLLRLRAFMDGIFSIVLAAAALLLALVYALSLRLRAGEFQTMAYLGAPRGASVRLVLAELALVGALAAAVAALALLLVATQSARIVSAGLL